MWRWCKAVIFAGLSHTISGKEKTQDVSFLLIAQIQLCRHLPCVAFCGSGEVSLLTVSTIQVWTVAASTGNALPATAYCPTESAHALCSFHILDDPDRLSLVRLETHDGHRDGSWTQCDAHSPDLRRFANPHTIVSKM